MSFDSVDKSAQRHAETFRAGEPPRKAADDPRKVAEEHSGSLVKAIFLHLKEVFFFLGMGLFLVGAVNALNHRINVESVARAVISSGLFVAGGLSLLASAIVHSSRK